MVQRVKNAVVAAAVAAGLFTTASQGAENLPSPEFFVEIVGPDSAASPRAAATEPTAAPATESTASPAARRYGPINSRDTLWSIAQQVRPDRSVSLYQTMIALYRRNPAVFKDGNINLLLNDRFLELPTRQQIRAVNANTAQAQFVALTQGTTGKPPVASSKPAPTPSASDTPAAAATKPAEARASEVPPEAGPVTRAEPLADGARAVEAGSAAVTDSPAEPDAAEAVTNLTPLEQQQLADVQVLVEQLSDSSEQLTSMAEANHRLKLRLQQLAEEVAALRADREADQAEQAQLLALLQRQRQASPVASDATSMLPGWLDPLALIGGGVVGVLSLILGVMLWLRKRSNRNDDAEQDDTALAFEELSPTDFDELLTVEQQETAEAEAAATEAFAVDENLFTPPAEQTEEDPDPESLLDSFEIADEPPGGDSGPDDDEDLSAAWEQMLNEEPRSTSDEDADQATTPEPAPQATSAPTAEPDELSDIAAADAVPAAGESDNDELSEAWASLLADEDDSALDTTEDDDTDLSDAWEKLLAEGDDPFEDQPAASPEGDPGSQPAAETAASEAPDPATGDEWALEWPDSDLSDDDTDPAPAATTDADVSETEKQLRQSLSTEGGRKEDTGAAQGPSTLEQQFIEQAPASDVDELFGQLGDNLFDQGEDEGGEDDESGFIDIDKLLSEAGDDEEADNEPYDDIRLDVGLNDFPEVMPEAAGVDVDADSEVGAKLDLARAYIEIDDADSARMLLNEVTEEGDDKLKQEAQKLLKRLG